MSTGMATVRGGMPLLILGIVVVTAFMAASMAFGWVGPIGSDDWVYIQTGRERIQDPWLIGTNHWAVRLPMTLPMAVSLAMFGESELTAALPTLLYTWATAIMVLLFLWRRAGPLAAILAGLFMVTAPLMAVSATSLRIDAVENFYVIASLLCFLIALERSGSGVLLLATGLLAGLAFITRPTAVALLALYGVLFLVGHGMDRRRYLLGLAGFFAVWLTESLYYLHGTGRWFYRLDIDFHHDQIVRAGTLLEAAVVAPLRMVLGSHNLGLAFWLLPLAAWYTGRATVAGERTAGLVRLLALFAGVWIAVFSVFATKLILDPRYLTPAFTAALIVIAIATQTLWHRSRRALAAAITAAILLTQGLGLYLENKDFMYASRWLVDLAQQHDEPVYTDPQTRERALFFLELAGMEQRTRGAPPPPGTLFLHVPRNAARGQYNHERWNPKDYEADGWPVVSTLDPGKPALSRWIERAGWQTRLPAAVWEKMAQANPQVKLLRRPAD